MSELRVIYATGSEGSKASPALLGQAMAALSCLSCGLALAPVYEHKGRTVLRFDHAFIWRAELVCPRCGAERRFVSDPMSAVRLGIGSLADGGDLG